MSEIPPYSQPPTSSEFAAYPRDNTSGSLSSLRELCAAYKSVNQCAVCLLVPLLVYALIPAVASASSKMLAAFSMTLMLLLVIACALFLVSYFRACVLSARALQTSVTLSVLIAIVFMLIPCGTLLYLIIAQQRLRKPLNEFGVKIGLRGISRAQIQEIEARLS
jgi:uncharacterized Tic20 family protein